MRALKSQRADKISSLPDALLCHILSYVSTKQSVRTSILSKRWLHVWTGLPNIDIDDSFLSSDPTLATDQSVHTSFTNFMTKVFNRGKKASLRKFALTCSKFDVLRVNEWILAAVKHRVSEIALSIRMEVPFKMSCDLFAYKELVILKLGKDLVLKVPNKTFCFPSLKELHLHNVVFDDASIHSLISCCPVLEELHVEHCSTKMWDTVVFSSPSLKDFVIDTLSGTEDEYSFDYKLIVDAPSLEVLEYTGYLATKGYCFRNLHSLTDAILDVAVGHERGHIRCFKDLFKGVANAETITLTGYTLEVLHLFFKLNIDDYPLFNNLTKLELGGNMYCGKVMHGLLHLSPNLEVLVVDEDLARKGDLNDFHWDWSSDVPRCVEQCLKVFEIWGFDEEIHVGVGEFIRDIISMACKLTKVTASQYKQQGRYIRVVEVNDELLVYLSSLQN